MSHFCFQWKYGIPMVRIWVLLPISEKLGTIPWKGDPIAYKGALTAPLDSIEIFCTRSHFLCLARLLVTCREIYTELELEWNPTKGMPAKNS